MGRDAGKCCEAKAKCDALECPIGQGLEANTIDEYYGAAACDSNVGTEDVKLCSQSKAKRNTLICPSGQVLQANATDKCCGAAVCDGNVGAEDVRLCCDVEAKRNTLECPVGQVLLAGPSAGNQTTLMTGLSWRLQPLMDSWRS